MITILRFFSVLFFTISLCAESSSQKERSLEQQVQALVDATGEDLNIGIYFRNLDTKQDKFNLHINRKFIPASTTKLFTAYAALSYLGADFQYKTTVLSDHSVSKKGVLSGNLYLKFSGDSTLSYQDLETMISSIKVSVIEGDLVIDDSLFDKYTTSPGGSTWDDTPFCYAAPKSAFIIDSNCSKAQMWPNDKIGRIANLDIADPSILKITNTVTTVRPKDTPCPYRSEYLGDNSYAVYGCMFNDMKEPVRLNFALPDNRLMAKGYIEKILQTLGIKLNGNVKFAKVSDKKVLYIHRSPLLRDIVIPVIHDSLNLASTSLFKYMGHQYTGQQGSDEAGEYMMRDFLRKQGLKSEDISLKDGSGESRYNLVTPKVFVDFMEKVYFSKVGKEFLAAIPHCGSNSTLKYRNVDLKYNKDIYAKTGSMKNVSSLVGYYLPGGNGTKYVFAIMVNNHNLPMQKVKELEEKIVYTILSN